MRLLLLFIYPVVCLLNKDLCELNVSPYSTWPYKTWVHSQTQNKAHWLAACGHVSASSQSLRFILSLGLYSSFITSRPELRKKGDIFPKKGWKAFLVVFWNVLTLVRLDKMQILVQCTLMHKVRNLRVVHFESYSSFSDCMHISTYIGCYAPLTGS